MTTIDLITVIQLILVLFLAIVMYVLLKRKILKPKALPLVLGLGTGVFVLVSSMITSLILRPISEFMDYAITNFLSSIVFGLIGYFGGRRFARRSQDEN